jgi:hypothetical protein
MSRLQIKGTLLYADNTPVVNGNVKITDLDLIDNNHDLILSDNSNNWGTFSGLSSEWKDTEGKIFGIKTPDILNLQFRATVNGRTHQGPFFLIGNNSVPIILPFNAPTPVSKPQRELIQIITLAKGLTDLDKVLYEFIEQQAQDIVHNKLGDLYNRVHVLFGADATFDNFCSRLDSVTESTNVKAVDVIYNTHGYPNRLYFHDSPGGGTKEDVFITEIQQKLSATQRNKLRMIFSTACYGQSHLNAWRAVGFKVASGSEGIYADSAVSFGAFLDQWAGKKTFGMAVNNANNAIGSNQADAFASAWYTVRGFRSFAAQVDSDRVISGNNDLRIYSTPV